MVLLHDEPMSEEVVALTPTSEVRDTGRECAEELD